MSRPPEQIAQSFVSESMNMVSRALAREEAPMPLRLTFVIGSGYTLVDKYGEVIEQGRGSGGLIDSAAKLVRLAIAKLSLRDQGKLAHRMLARDDDGELEGSHVPPFFSATIEVTSGSWVIHVSAHARGASAIIASLEGEIAPAEKAAA